MSTKDCQLDISRDEVNRIGEALKHEEFRKLFTDYCEEISNPENRKLYEKEITQLEKERGVDVTFINPEPGYVIKTSSDGATKTFINIATNDKIEKPSSASATNSDGQRGLTWSLPYTLAPPRRDMDKKSQMCHVYDVVFHSDALHLASRNASFRKLVNDTALDAVEKEHKVKLDRANLKFPKISYKGLAKPTVIRKRIESFDANKMEPSPIDSIYPPLPDESKSKPKVMKPTETPVDEYTTPKYKIVQRRGVEFHEMTHEVDAKLNVTIPSELVVTIDLPLLKTTQDANLDVTSKRIHLMSEKPAKYRLDINLPYDVKEDGGSAKFDKAKRQLIITLPVVPEKKLRIADFQREDSGIESDNQPTYEKMDSIDEHESESSHDSPVMELNAQDEDAFLDSNVDYVLPSFTFNQIDEILAFTLHVKNVDPSSIVIDRKDFLNTALIKFSSVGTGFFPIHYSFCVKFLSQQNGIFREITAEAWDNNIIFQFELNNYDFPCYEAGLNEKNLVSYDIAERLVARHPMTSQGQEIEDDSLSIEVRSDVNTELVIEVTRKNSESDTKLRQETSNDEVSEDVFEPRKGGDGKRQTKKATKKRNKKMRSMSESCVDQLKVINELDSLKLDENEAKPRKKARSMSESSDDGSHDDGSGDAKVQNHHQYKSILKNRSSFSECNESSIDDHQAKNFYSMSADFGICQSHDSLSESCKKTVRFSDQIKRQLFR
jgi:dynein assembly factor 2, axonemal